MVVTPDIIHLFCFAFIFNTGKHWCWEWWNSSNPSCPCTLISSISAVGSCFWWLPVWPAPSFSPTFASVLLWDSWWCPAASWVGDGQDHQWTEIFSQVSMQTTIITQFFGTYVIVTCVSSLHCDAVYFINNWNDKYLALRILGHSKIIHWIRVSYWATPFLFWVLWSYRKRVYVVIVGLNVIDVCWTPALLGVPLVIEGYHKWSWRQLSHCSFFSLHYADLNV